MKKTVCRVFSLLLCCVMALGSFPVLAETELSSVSVTVTAPTAGASPVNSGTAGDNSYTVASVQWSTDAPFAAGQTYQVQVVLQAAEDNSFSSAVSGKINGKSCMVEEIEPSAKIRLTCDFTVELPDTAIRQVLLTGLTLPAEGATPDGSLSAGDSSYRIHEVMWIAPGGQTMSATDRFQSGSAYTLRVVVKAQAGQSFDSAVTATVDGRDARCTLSGGDTLTLEMTCVVSQKINQVAVTGLTLPALSQKPDFSVEASSGAQYTVEQVAWRGWETAGGVNAYANLTANDSFLPGHTYQVAILLKAKAGSEFLLNEQGKPQVTATINGEPADPGSAVNGKEPAQYIMTGLEFTLDGDKTPIDQVTITEITAPSIGKKPSALAKVPEDALYTVDKVVWKRWDMAASDPPIMGSRETFAADTDYQVTVILKAKEEAAFATDRFGRPQVKATLNGNATNPPIGVEEHEPAEYIAVSYNFRTAEELITQVSILALEEPVTGKRPDNDVAVPVQASYEIEDVVWQWRDPKSSGSRYSDMMATDAFGTDREYRICVTLVALEDAEFATSSAGQPQVTVKFNGDPAKPATAVKDEDPARCIQVTFEFLLESDIKTVDRVSVEGLDLPVAGAVPDTEAEISFVARYTVYEIVWERLTNGKTQRLGKKDTFRAGESYRVTVVLKAKEDAEFAVSSTGRTQVTAQLNGETVPASPAGSRKLKEYISVSRDYTIYTVIEGAGARWTPNEESLQFRFSGETQDVQAVKMDGILLKENLYTVSKGSVVVELSYQCLSALKDGEHRLTVIYTDGVATADFGVYHDGSVPADGEEKQSGGLWYLLIPLMVALLCGAAALSVFLRKKGWL